METAFRNGNSNAASVEFDPAILPQRIAEARRPVLDQIEDNFSQSASDESQALRNALDALTALAVLLTVIERRATQPEIGEQHTRGR